MEIDPYLFGLHDALIEALTELGRMDEAAEAERALALAEQTRTPPGNLDS